MAKACTKRVSTPLVYAREQAIVPWEWIANEAREDERVLVWNGGDEGLRSTPASDRRDYWRRQPVCVGVWSEQGTVRRTLAPGLERGQVPLLPTHGHHPGTETHRTAVQEGRDTRLWGVWSVGDWDPSGMDMSERDLPERWRRYGASDSCAMQRFAMHAGDLDDRERQGLTFDGRDKARQAERTYGPRTKKGNDTQRPWFEARDGRRCCALDAIHPDARRRRVEQAILGHSDVPAWSHRVRIEAAECHARQEILRRWKTSMGGLATEETRQADPGLCQAHGGSRCRPPSVEAITPCPMASTRRHT
jgi:hypothetical protein